MNITDEQLNIELCKWRGWNDIKRCTRSLKPKDDGICWCGTLDSITRSKREYTFLPSHITGIEALGNMHEAERELTDDEFESYAKILMEDAMRSEINPIKLGRMVLSATAVHRAIALLRVVKPELFK